MYEISCILNQIPDANLQVRVGDTPVLKVTLYDTDGTAFDAGFEARLVVRRNDSDAAGEISIDNITETTPFGDNIYYFYLNDITFEPGNYECHIVVEDTTFGTVPAISPDYEIYSFESFSIEVLA
jgi:hypothetical protein